MTPRKVELRQIKPFKKQTLCRWGTLGNDFTITVIKTIKRCKDYGGRERAHKKNQQKSIVSRQKWEIHSDNVI